MLAMPPTKEITPNADSDQLRIKSFSDEAIPSLIDQLDMSVSPYDPKDLLAKFFPCLDKGQLPSSQHVRYTDTKIQQIGYLLSHIKTTWTKVTRTYIVLRVVNQLELLDKFIDLGFTDHWLPVSPQQLPEFLSPKTRQDFLKAQSIVLAEATDFKKGEDGQHKHFTKDEPLPFQTVSILGSGGFGQVDKVISKLTNKEYARKRIRREKLFRQTRESMKSFTAELEILKRLDHHHVVKIVGSYTDPNYLGLIMSPVAHCDLAAYLSTEFTSVEKKGHLRTFFGCLVTALAYLHDARIRHKDIKPQNILVKGHTVLLTDFGISYSSAESGHSTTEGTPAMTLRYCAPEVVKYEPRNSSSDVWSLGCVFVEMITVLKDQTIPSMRAYFELHGSRGKFFSNNLEAAKEWFLMLTATVPHSDNIPLQWAQNMLRYDRNLRPKSRILMETILSHYRSTEFCGSCCASFP